MQQIAINRLTLDEKEHKRVLASLVAQLRFLRANLELDIGGNHLIKNIKALLWARAALSGPESEAWGGIGERLLDRELAEQVLPDGMHYELSPTYHNQVFADLIDCYLALPDSQLRTRLADVLDRMAQVCADLRHPDGGVSLFSDGGLYFAYSPDDCLDTWARISGLRKASRAIFALPNAGYYGFHHVGSYGAQMFVVDCAELAPAFLPAHGHGDALAFEWSVDDERIFVDAGVYEYNPGPHRSYSRATRSHNTVNLDGKDQSEFWKSFRVGRRAHIKTCKYRPEPDGRGFTLSGSHDGYSQLTGSPIHEREFFAKPDYIRINDRVIGGSGQSVEANFLLHPNCSVEFRSDGCLIHRSSTTLRLLTSGEVKVCNASWHPDHGFDIPTTCLRITLGSAPCESTIEIVVQRVSERNRRMR